MNNEIKMYTTYATDTFKKIYEALDNNEKEWIDKTKENLAQNLTGKPLGYPWFREKKYLNKRLYFLIDEEQKRILFVSFSSKREQQKMIDFIKLNMRELLDLLRKL